jgi:hypothetical protein
MAMAVMGIQDKAALHYDGSMVPSLSVAGGPGWKPAMTVP